MNANVRVPVATLFRLLLGLAVGSSVPASAEGLLVHGFGTIGVAYVDEPSGWAFGRSRDQRVNDDALRADLDSLVGVQVNYAPSDKLELVGQATAKLLAEHARAGDYLGLAFLAWQPDADWKLRLGRVNLDAYLISEHRDVGFTYQFIRPPVEYYSRMPTSLDGADVTRTWMAGTAQWRGKLFVGHSSAGLGADRLKLWPLIGLVVSRESDGLLLRVSAVRGHAINNIRSLDPLTDGLQQAQQLPVAQVAADAAAMQATLSSRHLKTSYVAAALAYDRHDWLLTAEINRYTASHNSAIGTTSGYASIGRRFGPFSVFVTESLTTSDRRAMQAPDWQSQLAPLGPQLAQQAQQLANGAAMAINSLAARQSSTSLGTRWDVSPRVSLNAQWDRIHVHRDGSSLWPRADSRRADADVLAIAAHFLF